MPNRVPKEQYGARAEAPADHSSYLNDPVRFEEMRDRLTALGDEARSIRSQIPSGLDTDVERIQRQMQRLGERLDELSGGAYTSSSFRDIDQPPEVIVLGAAVAQSYSDPETGWEAGAMDALAQIYESGEPFGGEGAHNQTGYNQSGYQAPYQAAANHAAGNQSGDRMGDQGPRTGSQSAGSAGANDISACPITRASGSVAPKTDIPASRKLPVVVRQDETRNEASAAAAQADDRAPGRVWLNERFADIARRIEQSLAEIHPESSLLQLGQRFDQLEQRMTSVLSGVATRSDLKELRVAEPQMEDIASQLKQLRRQLTRLDSIDSQLGRLSEQLSDDRIGRLTSGRGSAAQDEGRLTAIESSLQTLSTQMSREQLAEIMNQSARGPDVGELRGMIESLIQERRHNDENNASMLETMQQAIIRVLDRLDALELPNQQRTSSAQPASGSMSSMASMSSMSGSPASQMASRASAAMAPMHDMAAHSMAQAMNDPLREEVERFTAELHRIEQQPYEIPPGIFADEEPAPAEAHIHAEPSAVPAMEFPSADFDIESAFARSPNEIGMGYPPAGPGSALEQSREPGLRQDFIAEAHRAKLKAATKLDAGLAADRQSELATKMGTLQPEPRKRRSFFSLRSPRVLMGILILLAMIPAAIFFMPRATTSALDDFADDMLPVSAPGSAAHEAKDAPIAPGSTGHDMMAPQTMPHDASPAIEPAPGAPGSTVVPRKQSQQVDPAAPHSGVFEDASQPMNIGYSHIDTASIPTGVTLGTGAGSEFESVPVALALSQAGADAVRAPGSDDKTANLPPVTVGPYSLRVAAAKGDASAQFEVAVRLAEGLGMEPDLKQSFQWYQRSAMSGFPMAQFRLGTLYERGLGVKTDTARAQVWYGRAAEQGNVKAIHNLAVLHVSRAKPDYTEAAKLFSQSAAYGLSDSQYNLAMLYESGLGVPRDLKEAYRWLVLAAASGDKESQKRRDALKAKLSAADRTAAEAMAKRFVAKPINAIANDFRAAGQAWRQNPGLFQRQG
jgi:localization factor PodJL